MSVWHEDIQPHEHRRHDNVRQEVDDEAHDRSHDKQVGNAVGSRRHEERDAGSEYYEYGEEEEHGEIVGACAEEAAWLLHLPDAVERRFDVAYEHKHGVEHEGEAHPEEDAALGVHQITVHEAHNDVCRLWLRLKCGAEPLLYVPVVAESTGDGEHHCHDGNDGEDGGISECRRLAHHPFGGEEPHGKNHFLCRFEQEQAHPAHATGLNLPDAGVVKVDYFPYLFFHLLSFMLFRKASTRFTYSLSCTFLSSSNCLSISSSFFSTSSLLSPTMVSTKMEFMSDMPIMPPQNTRAEK